MLRTQFPVVAGWALTVNKAQGLTIREGVVINLAGSARFRPASKHGLPFVAFTRSECFARTAFKNLPPWSDFVKRAELGLTAPEAIVRGPASGDAHPHDAEVHLHGFPRCRRCSFRAVAAVASSKVVQEHRCTAALPSVRRRFRIALAARPPRVFRARRCRCARRPATDAPSPRRGIAPVGRCVSL